MGDEEVLDLGAPVVVRARRRSSVLHDLLGRANAESQAVRAERNDDRGLQAALPARQRAGQHIDHAHVSLQPRRPVRFDADGSLAGKQRGGGRERRPLLTERRQHALDVAEEDLVRPDHQDTLRLERLAVGVEQVRDPVQGNGRLPGAGAALHDEGLVERRADDFVLRALDGRDDVAHPTGPLPLDGAEERGFTDHDDVVASAALQIVVEQLVVELEHGRRSAPEVPPADDAHRVAAHCSVERCRHRCAPIDDERVAGLVVDRQAPDVPGLSGVLVDAAEAQRGVAELQLLDPARPDGSQLVTRECRAGRVVDGKR
ncbi:MAG TPA: hypothetical protein VF230_13950 [Acidimicrobiales bacterium]